jgi:WD40 repeat protein
VGPVLRGASDSVRAVVFSPDGTRLAVGGLDNKVRLWDVKTKQPLGTPLEGHKSAITSLQFLPDGQHLLSASWDATVLLWGLSSPKPLQKLRGTGYLFGLALTPDGQSVFVAGAERALLRFSLSGESPLQRAATTPGRELTSVAMSPDGQALAAGSWDQAVHVFTRQKSATGEQLVPESTLTGHTASVDAVAFSPDGKLIASGSYDHWVRVWNRAQKSEAFAPLSGHSAGVAAVVFSPTGPGSPQAGLRAASSCGTRSKERPLLHRCRVMGLASWDWRIARMASGCARRRRIRRCGCGMPTPATASASRSACTSWPSAAAPLARMASSCWRAVEDDLLRVFAITSDAAGKLTLTAQGEPLLGHRDRITQVTVLPGGQRALTSSEDRTLRLWDLRSLSPIHTALSGHHQVVRGIATSPQAPGLAASVGHDGALRLWDLDPASWAQLACIRAGRDLSQTERAQFLPSNSSLVVCPQK